MKNAAPLSKKLFYADAFTDKLFPLLLAVLLFYCPYAHARIRLLNRHKGRNHDNNYNLSNTAANKSVSSAAPTFSYSSPQTYIAGTAVTLTPTSSGVATLGFSTTPTTVGSGFTRPNGVAVDAAGNVYLADAGHNAVKKIPAGGGSPVSIGSGFSNPSGVAVDAAGNVYVADAGHNAVKKILASSGSTVSIGSGFNNPLGVAVDVEGNVYVADAGNGAVELINSDGVTFLLSAGYNKPSGVAVDFLGTNVYIAESGVGAGIYHLTRSHARSVSFGSGFNQPVGVSVDAIGNVLVADAGNNIIYKVPASGGASTALGAGFSGPTGVVQDAAGNVYVADNGHNFVKKITPTGGYFISSPLPAGLNFNRSTGVINGTPTQASAAKNYIITAYNSSGSKSATVNIRVNLPPPPTMSYSSPHSYTVGSAITSLAPTSSHVAAKSYSPTPVVLPLGFVFPSTIPKDAAGNVYTLDVDNSQVLKTPPGGSPGVYATVSNRPNCVATDAAGNLFIGLFYENQIEKIPVGGGAHVILNAGFDPLSIAVDPAGNLFIADGHSPDNPTGGGVEELFADGGATTLTDGAFIPNQVAVDTVGNVYVQGAGNEKISPSGGYYISRTLPAGLTFNNATGVISGTPTKSSPATVYTITAYNNFSSKSTMVNITVKGPPIVSYSSPHNYTANVASPPIVPTSSGVAPVAYSTPVLLPPGFIFPSIAAKDAVGNVYTLDADNYHVLKTPAGGGAVIIYATVSDRPTCIASDAAGNLFVGLFDEFHIEKIPIGGGAHVTLNAGFDAFGIAVDPTGNLFIADGHAPDNPFGGGVEEYFTGGGGGVTLADGSNKPNNIAVDTVGNVYVQGLGIDKITPTGGYYISASLPPGLSFSNATGVISGTPTIAGPARVYTITTYNSFGSSQATLTIKVLSKNDDLARLLISKGTLVPAFDMNTSSYTALVGNTIEGISVTPTTANPASAVTVNGETVISGSTSSNQPLLVGSNAISTVVTAENGVTRTYTITVTRAGESMAIATNDTTPGDLSVQTLTLYPNPNPGDELNIMLKNYQKQAKVTIYLYSATGGKMKTLNIQTDVAGSYNAKIPITSTGSPKCYIVRTVSDSGIKEGKVMVQ